MRLTQDGLLKLVLRTDFVWCPIKLSFFFLLLNLPSVHARPEILHFSSLASFRFPPLFPWVIDFVPETKRSPIQTLNKHVRIKNNSHVVSRAA